MGRTRPLKVYVNSSYAGPEIMAALDRTQVRANDRQVSYFVAARSLKEAAALMSTNIGSSTTVGGASIYARSDKPDDPLTQTAMAKPGQVFVTKYDWRRREGRFVEVGVSVEKPRVLVLGAQTTLDTGEALVAQQEADKLARKELEVRRVQERKERAQRAEETKKANTEALDRLRPKLASLGIHPDTVTLGRSGIELPAESLERIVAMAVELDQIMG